MTEQEAIIRLAKEIDILNKAPVHVNKLQDVKIAVEAREMAISALEEIQQYRALGTVEDLKALSSMEIEEWKKLKQYRKLGTVEELRKEREKQVPKKPNFEGDGYDDKGDMIYDTWICPCCNKNYELDYDEYDYCPSCGQAIDWS